MTIQVPKNLLFPPAWQPVLRDSDIPRLLRLFTKFVGATELDRKLKTVERALNTSPGEIYRDYWIRPTNWLWLAIGQMRNQTNSVSGLFSGPVTPDVHRAAEFAKMIQLLHRGMPDWKRDDVRSRVLSDELLTPVHIEMMAALHYRSMGCRVTWIKPSKNSRTYDMLIEYKSFEFELECKAKSIDAGRTISRRRFYYFCDSVLPMILEKRMVGAVEIIIPKRFPSDTGALLEATRIAVETGAGVCPDGTTVTARLVPDVKEEADPRVEIANADKLRGTFGHLALIFPPHELKRPCKPLIVVCRSCQDDDLLVAVESDLRDASDQLSGTKPASIVCYVPELGSFEGLNEPNTGIAQMTSRFFQRASSASIFSVEYVTDPQVFREPYGLRSQAGSLRFRNPSPRID